MKPTIPQQLQAEKQKIEDRLEQARGGMAPRLCSEFQAAMAGGDYAKALEYQDRLMPLHKAIFMEPGVTGTKYALSKLGICNNVVRAPLTTIETSTEKAIDAAMVHAGLIN